MRVKVATPPGAAGATAKATGVPVGHSSLKPGAVMLTALLKVKLTVAFSATAVAPFAGTVEETVGGVSMVKVIT